MFFWKNIQKKYFYCVCNCKSLQLRAIQWFLWEADLINTHSDCSATPLLLRKRERRREEVFFLALFLSPPEPGGWARLHGKPNHFLFQLLFSEASANASHGPRFCYRIAETDNSCPFQFHACAFWHAIWPRWNPEILDWGMWNRCRQWLNWRLDALCSLCVNVVPRPPAVPVFSLTLPFQCPSAVYYIIVHAFQIMVPLSHHYCIFD